MHRIKTIAKKLLSPDVRTLIKGGLLNDDLSISDRGRAALDAITLEANMSSLVELAQERIEEDKEEGGCKKS